MLLIRSPQASTRPGAVTSRHREKIICQCRSARSAFARAVSPGFRLSRCLRSALSAGAGAAGNRVAAASRSLPRGLRRRRRFVLRDGRTDRQPRARAFPVRANTQRRANEKTTRPEGSRFARGSRRSGGVAAASAESGVPASCGTVAGVGRMASPCEDALPCSGARGTSGDVRKKLSADRRRTDGAGFRGTRLAHTVGTIEKTKRAKRLFS